MKKWKKGAAGLLSAAMVLSLIGPAANAAQESGGGGDTVTVKVENVPGGLLEVYTDLEGEPYLPLDREVELPRGTELTIDYAATADYGEEETELGAILVNGSLFVNEDGDLGSSGDSMVVEDDTTIKPIFYRGDFETEVDDSEYSLMRAASLEAEEAVSYPRLRTTLGLLAEGSKGGAKLSIYFEALSAVPTKFLLYPLNEKEPIGEVDKDGNLLEYEIASVTKIDQNGKTEELDKNAFHIDLDYADEFNDLRQYLVADTELEANTAYQIQIMQRIGSRSDGETRLVRVGALTIQCGLYKVSAVFPLATKGVGMELDDLSVWGPSVYAVPEDARNVSELLKDVEDAVIYDVNASGWKDEEGGNISDKTLAQLEEEGFVSSRGGVDAYAMYQDYDVEVPELRENKEFVQWLPDYTEENKLAGFHSSDGKMLKNSFILYNGAWHYADATGKLVENQVVDTERETLWYAELEFENFYLGAERDLNTSGKCFYYLDAYGTTGSDVWVQRKKDGAYLYFGEDMRGVTGEVTVAEGKEYQTSFDFGTKGFIYAPGWTKAEDEAGELQDVFRDQDGKMVKKAFVMAPNGEGYLYLDENGKTPSDTVVKTAKTTNFYALPTWKAFNGETYAPEPGDFGENGELEYGETDYFIFDKMETAQPDKAHKYSNVYYHLNGDGYIDTTSGLLETEAGLMYFDGSGKALQDADKEIDGVLYHFDKDGIGTEVDLGKLETGKPSKVAAEIEKLKLTVDQAEVNTEEDAKAYVEKLIADKLPSGFELEEVKTATPSNAERGFKAAAYGEDGYYNYEVTISKEGEEDATPSNADRKQARVATDSNAGRFYATAENCKLVIKADPSEKPDETGLNVLTDKARETVSALKFTQEMYEGADAAVDEAKQALQALLAGDYAENYAISVKKGRVQEPTAGTKDEPDGKNGSVEITVTVSMQLEGMTKPVEKSFTEKLEITATAYVPEEPEKPTDPDNGNNNQGGGNGGSGSGSNGGSGSSGGSSSGSVSGHGYTGGTGLQPGITVGETKGTWQKTAQGEWKLLISGSNAYAKNSWYKVNGKWYYFNGEETAVKGWQQVDGRWYYMDPANNWMMTGWLKDEAAGQTYFLHADGAMALGWVQVEGKFYYMNTVQPNPQAKDALPYGAMLRNTVTPDGYQVGADGAWDEMEKGF